MTDDIRKPSHYIDGRKHEPMDVISDWGLNFRLGNVVKYVSRAGRKGSALEDLEKAAFYLEREIKDLKDELPASYPAPDYDEVYEFFLESEVPFDATGSIDLWDDNVGPIEPIDGNGNNVYAGDYKGPLYAPYPQAKETAHLQYVGDAEWDDSCDYATGYQGKRDEQFFEEDEIIRIFERRGLIIGVKKDGSSCELGGNGKCL